MTSSWARPSATLTLRQCSPRLIVTPPRDVPTTTLPSADARTERMPLSFSAGVF